MDNLYASLEEQYGLPSGTLNAIKGTERSKTTDVSPKGAKGIFQFMPETAKAYNVDTSDDVSSATGAARFMSDLIKKYGSFRAAIAHYNGGTKAGNAVVQGNEPPAKETRDYLESVHSKMPQIDISAVKWDEEPASKIDPSTIKWDNEEQSQRTQKYAEKSGTELFGLGAKKAVTDLASGAKQLIDIPAQYLESKFGDSAIAKLGKQLGMPTAKESAAMTEEQVAKDRAEGEALLENPEAVAGYLAGNVGTTLAGGAALRGAGLFAQAPRAVAAGEALINPQTYRAAIGAGALQGALQPTLPEENRGFNTAIGAGAGALGLGAVNALGQVAQPVKNVIGEAGQKAVQVLKDAGVPLDAAQATGSAMLTRAKAMLSDNPFTAGAEQAFNSFQQSAYNRAISKTMGENSLSITPDIIAKAKTRIGGIYDDVASKVNINYRYMGKALSDIEDEAKHVLNEQQYSVVKNNIDNIIEKATKGNGVLDASQYQNVKKTLDKLSMSKDSDIASYAREMRDALNQGLSKSAEASGNKQLVAQLKEANKQWGNMRKIEDVALRSPSGDVSPAQLYNSLTTKAKRNAFYAEDKSLAELASAGKQILPSKTPNSGTVARLAAQAAPAAVGGALYGAYEGDWGGAAKGAALGYMLPKAIQSALNNPASARYLEQGIRNVPLRTLLEMPKRAGAQKIPAAAIGTYLQSLPPESTR